jgi:hypothetical protein
MKWKELTTLVTMGKVRRPRRTTARVSSTDQSVQNQTQIGIYIYLPNPTINPSNFPTEPLSISTRRSVGDEDRQSSCWRCFRFQGHHFLEGWRRKDTSMKFGEEFSFLDEVVPKP